MLPSKLPLSDAQAKEKFDRLAELLESDETKTQNLRVAKELIHLREEKLALDTLIFQKRRTLKDFVLWPVNKH